MSGIIDLDLIYQQRHATDAQIAVVLEELHRLETALHCETSTRRTFRDAMVERVAVARQVVAAVHRKIGRHRRGRDAGRRQREEWRAREEARGAR